MHIANLSAGAVVLPLQDAFAQGCTEVQYGPESAFNATIAWGRKNFVEEGLSLGTQLHAHKLGI